jgi:predicted dehydrogenase
MRFGLIGTGFMGKAHAIALRTVGTVFPEVPAPELSLLVDSNLDKASADAAAWGFARAGSDWRAVCRDPDIDVPRGRTQSGRDVSRLPQPGGPDAFREIR